MKKWMIITLGLAGLPAVIHAQQTSHMMPMRDTASHRAMPDARFRSYSSVVPFSKLDQRKIYHWAIGQRATPTGRQTASRNAKYARVFGDSAVVVKGPVRESSGLN